METNPFQSPSATDQLKENSVASQQSPEARRAAEISVRAAILILLVAGLFNFYAFDHAIIGTIIPPRVHMVVRVIGLVEIATITVLSWILLVPMLEGLGRFVRHLTGRRSEVAAWNDAVYRSLQPAVYLAIPGAIVWGIWVYGFYFAHFDFLILSYAVGIPAHLLAAALYLPLIIRWYTLARTKSAQQPNGAAS